MLVTTVVNYSAAAAAIEIALLRTDVASGDELRGVWENEWWAVAATIAASIVVVLFVGWIRGFRGLRGLICFHLCAVWAKLRLAVCMYACVYVEKTG